MTPETTAALCFAGSAVLAALALLPRRDRPAAARLTLIPEGRLVSTVPVGQSIRFTLAAADAGGNPDATLAAPAAVTSSDLSVLTVSPDAVGVGATVTATGVKPGVATVTVSDGSLSATAEVTVASGPAVSLSLVPVPG